MKYRVKPSANRKHVKELLSRLPKGYKIGMVEVVGADGIQARTVNKRHPCVITPDGQLLRTKSGRPVMVANTPGTRWSLKLDLIEILEAIENREAA